MAKSKLTKFELKARKLADDPLVIEALEKQQPIDPKVVSDDEEENDSPQLRQQLEEEEKQWQQKLKEIRNRKTAYSKWDKRKKNS